MAYRRPTNRTPLSSADKLNLLKDYMEHYRQLAASDGTVLNRKVPRGAFGDLLDRLGEMLLTESIKLTEATGPIRTFLDANPLPPAMAELAERSGVTDKKRRK